MSSVRLLEAHPEGVIAFQAAAAHQSLLYQASALQQQSELFDDSGPVDFTEEDVVYLHWKLLEHVRTLADAEAPLAEQFDILRWVFTDAKKASAPFSFENCVRVVANSPLSPLPYIGGVDQHELRTRLRNSALKWFHESLQRYPERLRREICANPDWAAALLERNPQALNEIVRNATAQPDLFE
jgi:hypothetical protein